MKRVITINSNDLEKSLDTKELLTKKLKENNFLVSSKLEENTELIISIGGDGSFLKTIQDFKFPNVPMVVINTGHLGFFAEFDPDEIDEFIELYKNNNFTIQEVHPLKGSICTKERSKDIFILYQQKDFLEIGYQDYFFLSFRQSHTNRNINIPHYHYSSILEGD